MTAEHGKSRPSSPEEEIQRKQEKLDIGAGKETTEQLTETYIKHVNLLQGRIRDVRRTIQVQKDMRAPHWQKLESTCGEVEQQLLQRFRRIDRRNINEQVGTFNASIDELLQRLRAAEAESEKPEEGKEVAEAPRSAESILKAMGLPLEGKELQERAQQAVDKYGEETIRAIHARVTMLEKIPKIVQIQIFGSDAPKKEVAVALIAKHIDLSDTRFAFLLQNPEDEIRKLREKNIDIISREQQEIDRLQLLQREQLKIINKETAEATYDLLDVFTDKIEIENDAMQRSVDRIKELRDQIDRERREIMPTTEAINQLDIAITIFEAAEARNAGREEEANRRIARIWENYGNELRETVITSRRFSLDLPHSTPVKYRSKRINGKEVITHWSPDEENWMTLDTLTVTGGNWKGRKPAPEQQAIIRKLHASNGDPNVLTEANAEILEAETEYGGPKDPELWADIGRAVSELQQKGFTEAEGRLYGKEHTYDQAMETAVEQQHSIDPNVDLLDQVRAKETFTVTSFYESRSYYGQVPPHDVGLDYHIATLAFPNGILRVFVTSKAKNALENIPKGAQPLLLKPVKSIDIKRILGRPVLEIPLHECKLEDYEIGYIKNGEVYQHGGQKVNLETHDHPHEIDRQIRMQRSFRVEKYDPDYYVLTRKGDRFGSVQLRTVHTQAGKTYEGVNFSKEALAMLQKEPPPGMTLVLKREPRSISLKEKEGERDTYYISDCDTITEDDLSYAKVENDSLVVEEGTIGKTHNAGVDILKECKGVEETTDPKTGETIYRATAKHGLSVEFAFRNGAWEWRSPGHAWYPVSSPFKVGDRAPDISDEENEDRMQLNVTAGELIGIRFKGKETRTSVSALEKEREEKTRDILRTLNRDPSVNYIKRSATSIERSVKNLQEILKSKDEGSARQAFITFAQNEARPMYKLLCNPETLKNARSARASLIKLKKEKSGIAHGGLEKQINAQIKAIDGFIAMIESGRTRHLMEAILDKSNFHADNWSNFFRYNLPQIVGAIVIATIAVTSIIVTWGTASPFWIAAASAGGGLVAQEVITEAQYHIEKGIAEREGLLYTRRSRIGKWKSGKKVYNPETGEYEKLTFIDDVTLPYVKEFAWSFAITYGTIVGGSIAGSQFSRLLQNTKIVEKISERSGIFKILARKLAKMNKSEVPYEKTFKIREIMKRIVEMSPKEIGEEFGDEFSENILERMLNNLNAALPQADRGKIGWGTAAAFALSAIKSTRIGKSTIIYDTSKHTSTQITANQERRGCIVTDMGKGYLHIREPNGNVTNMRPAKESEFKRERAAFQLAGRAMTDPETALLQLQNYLGTNEVDNQTRIELAGSMLGTSLNTEQQNRLLELYGQTGIDLRAELMKENCFTQQQAELLINSGILTSPTFTERAAAEAAIAPSVEAEAEPFAELPAEARTLASQTKERCDEATTLEERREARKGLRDWMQENGDRLTDDQRVELAGILAEASLDSDQVRALREAHEFPPTGNINPKTGKRVYSARDISKKARTLHAAGLPAGMLVGTGIAGTGAYFHIPVVGRDVAAARRAARGIDMPDTSTIKEIRNPDAMREYMKGRGDRIVTDVDFDITEEQLLSKKTEDRQEVIRQRKLAKAITSNKKVKVGLPHAKQLTDPMVATTLASSTVPIQLPRLSRMSKNAKYNFVDAIRTRLHRENPNIASNPTSEMEALMKELESMRLPKSMQQELMGEFVVTIEAEMQRDLKLIDRSIDRGTITMANAEKMRKPIQEQATAFQNYLKAKGIKIKRPAKVEGRMPAELAEALEGETKIEEMTEVERATRRIQEQRDSLQKQIDKERTRQLSQRATTEEKNAAKERRKELAGRRNRLNVLEKRLKEGEHELKNLDRMIEAGEKHMDNLEAQLRNAKIEERADSKILQDLEAQMTQLDEKLIVRDSRRDIVKQNIQEALQEVNELPPG